MMSNPIKRALSVAAILLALAGATAAGLWLNKRYLRDTPARTPREEGASGKKASRMTNIVQQKADGAFQPAPPPDSSKPAKRPPQEQPTPENPVFAHIRGRLVDAEGNPVSMDLLVFSPEGRFRVRAVNGMFEAGAIPGVMRIIGQYQQGTELVMTPEVKVEAPAGKVTGVDLVVAAPARVGTPGFQYKAEGDYLEVLSVTPGSAAGDAGMDAGDAIIEIGGVPLKDIAPDRIDEVLNGPAGTAVSVTVVARTAEGMREFKLELERR